MQCAVARRMWWRCAVSVRRWYSRGCGSKPRDVIQTLARERKHAFALERAVFLIVLHRLSVVAPTGLRIVGSRIIGSTGSTNSPCTSSIGDGLAGRGTAGQ